MKAHPSLLLALCLFSSHPTWAAQGSFSTLIYNVAGLLEPFSSALTHRQSATEQISCYIKPFDLVNVQEDFNYHAALYDSCDDHPYRSPTSGGMGIGSGMNTLSRFEFSDFTRVRWRACNGVDCLTPKGFTLARVQLPDGATIDVYNVHAQAQTEPADLAARRKDILQLRDYIQEHSAGQAVIVMGDTNTRYTRGGDNPRELLDIGFTDAWVELLRVGDVPQVNEDKPLLCEPAYTSADCEIVDKVLYRNGEHVKLRATRYAIQEDAKTADGQELSDHPPTRTDFEYSTD